MSHSKTVKSFIIILTILGGLIFTIDFFDVTQYKGEYLFVLFSYWIMGILFIMLMNREDDTFVFEPVILVFVLEFMTYSVAPLISILTSETDLRGHYVMDGCIKATFVYIITTTVFLLAYFGRVRGPKVIYSKIEWESEVDENIIEDVNEKQRKLIVIVNMLLWLLGFAFFTRYLIQQGYGISYILTLGLRGKADRSLATESSIDVLFNMRFFMPTSCLYLSQYYKKKPIVVGMYIITFMEYTAYGFRNILVLLIVAPILLYSIKNKKKPNMIYVIGVLVGMLLLISAVEIMRSSVRQGLGIGSASWSRFNLLSIWQAVQGNFDLYKTLYGCVTYVPSQHFYTLGDTLIILTIVTCIPRAIWPGKPTSYVRTLSAQFIGKQALKEAWALSTYCEYYVEFGIIGCLVCGWLFGIFCKNMTNWYLRKNRTIDSMIMYSVVYPMLMLLAVRGYMPINFWQIIFLIVPVYCVKYIKRNCRFI